jgi:hypothetical protein
MSSFGYVKLAIDKITLCVFSASLGKIIKKSNVLSIDEEKKMLAQEMCRPTTPTKINLCFGYFYMCNFLIYGCQELKNVNFEEFFIL